jgi:uncharacterized protein (DUF1778 family)
MITDREKIKSTIIGFRVSPYDRSMLHIAAQNRGLTITEYLRNAAYDLLTPKNNIAA